VDSIDTEKGTALVNHTEKELGRVLDLTAGTDRAATPADIPAQSEVAM
jgi:hypothetical protein